MSDESTKAQDGTANTTEDGKEPGSRGKGGPPQRAQPEARDLWDKLDKVGRLVGALVTAAVLIVVAVLGREVNTSIATAQLKARDQEQDISRKLAIIEQQNNREIATESLRGDLFSALGEYVVPELSGDSRKVAVLSALHGNFSKLFNTRPIIELFAEEIKDRDAQEGLRRLVKDVARQQVNFLLARGGKSTQVRLRPGVSEPICEFEGEHSIDITIEEPTVVNAAFLRDVRNRVEVRLTLTTGEDHRELSFAVTYMDSPYIDNLAVHHVGGEVHRIALLLIDIKKDSGYLVTLELVHFPEDILTPSDRPSYDELVTAKTPDATHANGSHLRRQ